MVNLRLCKTARLFSFLWAWDFLSFAKEVDNLRWRPRKNLGWRYPWNLAKILQAMPFLKDHSPLLKVEFIFYNNYYSAKLTKEAHEVSYFLGSLIDKWTLTPFNILCRFPYNRILSELLNIQDSSWGLYWRVILLNLNLISRTLRYL